MDQDSSPGQSRSGNSLSIPILLVLVAGGMAATTNAQVFALLLAPTAADFGISIAQLGALRAIEEVVAILTGITLAPFIDRNSRKRLLLCGLALMGLAAGIASISTAPSHLLGFFFVDGVSKIFLFSTLLAMPGDLARGQRLERALGFIIGSFAMAGFTIIPIVGYVASRYSWREGYLVALATAVVTFALVLLVIPSIPAVQRPHGSPLRQLAQIIMLPGLVAALTGAFLRFTVFGAVLTFSSAFLIDHHGVSIGRTGMYFSLGAAAFLVASVLSGFFLRFVGTSRTLVPGGVLAAACVLTAYSPGLPLRYAGLALLATVALMGIHENASTSLLLRLSQGHRGAAMSLNELSAAAGSLIGISLGALALRQLGFPGIGLLLALSGLLAALVTFLAIRTAGSGPVAETVVSSG
jgi:predicted MFS family arabinose efflux permease